MGKKIKRACISGISGQDGSYLAEYLISIGYDVYGIIRRHSVAENQQYRLAPIRTSPKLHVRYGDLLDQTSIEKLLSEVQPDEIYNLAAQSHVRISFDIPQFTVQTNSIGVVNILEAYKRICPDAKFYQACYDTKTEVITPNGIKKHSELNVGDLVYTLNPLSREMEVKPILKKYEYNYNGEMYHFGGKRMDMMVTPNHQMIYKRDEEECIHFIRADEFKTLQRYDRNSNISLPNANWNGVDYDMINFKDFIDVDFGSTQKNKLLSINSWDFFYLMGLYIGDGYTKRDKSTKVKFRRSERTVKKDNISGRFISEENNLCEIDSIVNGSNSIQFAIPKNDKSRKRLISTLIRNGIEFTEKHMTVEFSSYTLSKMFKLCGENAYNKRIPLWMLDANKILLGELFNGLIGSDGHNRKKEKYRYSYTTVCKDLAGDVIALFYKLGHLPNLKETKPKEIYFIKDKRYINSKTAYIITFGLKSTNKFYNYNINTLNYEGKVWCLEVEENHNFLTIRNGKIAFCGNSSSEMFGNSLRDDGFQDENTPMNPVSPYGCSKLFAFKMVQHYRRAYNLHACNGILFNHESPRRGSNFVTSKVVKTACEIKLGLADKLVLGNLDSFRDWGHSKDYVKAMHLLLNHDVADDFVVSTQETHSVREMCEYVFNHLGLDYKDYVTQDSQFLRSEELKYLCGDSSKIRTQLGWKPEYDFKQLMVEMCDHWMDVLQNIPSSR